MFKKNAKAPDFKIPSTSNHNYSLKDSIGKQTVLDLFKIKIFFFRSQT